MAAEMARWVRAAALHADMSQAELARQLQAKLSRPYDRAAINKMMLDRPKRGQKSRRVSAEEMLAISQITGFPAPVPQVQYLEETLLTSDAEQSEDEGRGLIRVPEYEVGAGGNYAGGISQEEQSVDRYGNRITSDVVRTHWGFPVPFLRDELRVNPSRISIVPIHGDSMIDALFDGDRAVLALDQTDISQGGIFALLDDMGSLIIKQVEMIRGRSSEGTRYIRCKSRNPQYETFELAMIEPVRIIGRVACKLSRI